VKVRLRYSKLGKVRFVGNLDVTRIWERALRKAELPVAYSTGFSPRPRLSFGLALPLAAESVAEYLDVEFATEVRLDGLAQRLSECLPVGFAVLAAAPKQDGQRSLQEDVVACHWQLTVRDLGVGEAGEAIDRALAASTLPLDRERKGERRTDDVRPAIEHLSVAAAPDDEGVAPSVIIAARLATVGRGLRPSELVAVLVPDRTARGEDGLHRIMRTHQWIDSDGDRQELLPVTVAVPTPVGV
jgi:radical SAM-linked protein